MQDAQVDTIQSAASFFACALQAEESGLEEVTEGPCETGDRVPAFPLDDLSYGARSSSSPTNALAGAVANRQSERKRKRSQSWITARSTRRMAAYQEKRMASQTVVHETHSDFKDIAAERSHERPAIAKRSVLEMGDGYVETTGF